MKKLGKVTILSTREYEALRRDLEDTTAALAWKRDNRLVECNIAFQEGKNAGKFHAAGGYSHTLPKLKEELRQAQNEVARYKPIGEIFVVNT